MLKDGFPFESWISWVHSPVTTEDSCVFKLGESQWKHLYVPENCNLSWGVDTRKGDKNGGGVGEVNISDNVEILCMLGIVMLSMLLSRFFDLPPKRGQPYDTTDKDFMQPKSEGSHLCGQDSMWQILGDGCFKIWEPPWKPFRSQYPIWVYHHVSKMITTTTIFPHH